MINKILPVLLLIVASSSLIFSQDEAQKEEIDILRPSKALKRLLLHFHTKLRYIFKRTELLI